MGSRLRLRAGYDISGMSGDARVIATALKRYGMIVADNGSDFYISGSTDPRWNDDNLNQLKSIPGSAFEVVKPTARPSPTAEAGSLHLGFAYTTAKDGSVRVTRNGAPVAVLGGRDAARLCARLEGATDEEERQLLLARATGNYKRGNERR